MISLLKEGIMNKKCTGCGAFLQTTQKEEVGYVKKENLEKSFLCERCFRIRHYGDYKIVIKDNAEYLKILDEVNKTNDLVILVVDVFQISEDLNKIGDLLSNPILLVLSKRDILPKDIYEQKILDYIDRFSLKIVDKILISSNKNYQMDELLNKIYQYKNSNRVYVIGQSNAGKSTLINKLLYNYSDNETVITTSMLPSTTLGTMEIELKKDLTLIDTPGLLDDGNLTNLVTGKELKKIIPSREMKPITYQIKVRQTILIDEYAHLDCFNPTNITLFFSDKLKIERTFERKNHKDLVKKYLDVASGKDIVINGLGFIKVSKDTQMDVYVKDGVSIYIRDSLI